MTTCPTDEAMAALADGVLPETERAEIETHLARCHDCASMMAELAMLVAPSASNDRATIGRYELAEPLGTGGMGIVVEAFDPLLSRRVAIKVVRPDKAISRARVLAEARALAVLADPNILTIHDVIDSDRGICLVTELVDGENADAWRKRCQPTWAQIRALYLQVARGLASVHAHGLLHRDIKPANIFVGRDGRPRIGDFGLVSDGTAAVGGTVGFMAPEQAAGATIDVRADQFALAMSMIQCATGDVVPAGTPAMELSARIPLADRRTLARAIAPRPEDRFPRVTELVAALETAPRSRGGAFALAGLVAAAAVVIAVVWRRDGGEPTAPRIEPPPAVAMTPAPPADAAVADTMPIDAEVAITKTPRKSPPHETAPAPVDASPPVETGPTANELEHEMSAVMGNNDAAGCARVLDQLVAIDARYEKHRPYCEMLAGHCKAAVAALVPKLGEAPLRTIVGDYCPPDGDIVEGRARRALGQLARNKSPTACKQRAAWVTSLAATPADAELFAMSAVECYAGIGQCDKAGEQAALLGTLRGTSQAAEMTRIAPNCDR